MIRDKKQTGSILINMLAAIGVIAMMAAIAIPALETYQPNIKLKAEGRRLISDLRYAQQLTITEQKIHYLEMDPAGGSYALIREDSPATTIKTVLLDAEIDFQSITGLDNNRVVFNSYGAVSQSGEVVLANSKNDTITVNIKPSGYVQMQP